MKQRKITTVTTDEEMVRLAIYDGEIPLGEAGGRLLELALLQHHRGDAVLRHLSDMTKRIEDMQRIISTPWIVRVWRALRLRVYSAHHKKMDSR